MRFELKRFVSSIPDRPLLQFVLFMLIGLWMFSPSFHGPPVSDDLEFLDHPKEAYFESVDGLRQLWTRGKTSAWFPVTYSSLWLEYQICGDTFECYRLTNLLLHASNATMLVWLFRYFGVPWAFPCALLFFVHPLNASSVAWIIERKNTLSFCLLLSAFILYLRKTGAAYVCAVFLFTLALLAKVTVAMYVPVLFLITTLRSGVTRTGLVQNLLRIAPFAAIAFAVGLFGLHQEMSVSSPVQLSTKVELITRLANAGDALGFYFQNFFLPGEYAWAYDDWKIGDFRTSGLIWLAFFLMLLIYGAIRFSMNRGQGTTFVTLLLCYITALLPFLGFLQVAFFRTTPVADHWQYHAMPFLIALVSFCIFWITPEKYRRSVLAPGYAGLVFVLSWFSFDRAGAFSSHEQFWGRAIQRSPSLPDPYHAYGAMLIKRGQPHLALSYLQRALSLQTDESLKNYRSTLFDIAHACLLLGRYDESIRLNGRLLALDDKNWEAWSNLGVAFYEMGDLGRARDAFHAALSINPEAKGPIENLKRIQEDERKP